MPPYSGLFVLIPLLQTKAEKSDQSWPLTELLFLLSLAGLASSRKRFSCFQTFSISQWWSLLCSWKQSHFYERFLYPCQDPCLDTIWSRRSYGGVLELSHLVFGPISTVNCETSHTCTGVGFLKWCPISWICHKADSSQWLRQYNKMIKTKVGRIRV